MFRSFWTCKISATSPPPDGISTEITFIIHSLCLQFNRWVLLWNDFNCSYPQHAVIPPQGFVFCCLYSVGQLMVKLVVWIRGIPLWTGLLPGCSLRIPNHQFTMCWFGGQTPNLLIWDTWISRVPCNLHHAPTGHILQDPWDWYIFPTCFTSFTKSNSTIRVQYLEVQDT